MHVIVTGNLKEQRSLLKRLLEQDSELSVVADVAEASALLAQLQRARPDLVLLDWELPGSQETDLMSALHCPGRRVKVIVFSQRVAAHHEALAAGADAFVSVRQPVEELLNTIRAVAGLSPCYI